jgi:hypothetical protein
VSLAVWTNGADHALTWADHPDAAPVLAAKIGQALPGVRLEAIANGLRGWSRGPISDRDRGTYCPVLHFGPDRNGAAGSRWSEQV